MNYEGHIKRAKQTVWLLEKNLGALGKCESMEELRELLPPNEEKEITETIKGAAISFWEFREKAFSLRMQHIEEARMEVERTIQVYNSVNDVSYENRNMQKVPRQNKTGGCFE